MHDTPFVVRMSFVPPIVVFLCATAISMHATQIRADTGSGDDPRALISGYLANRESFQQIECRYALHSYRPENEESVLLGRVTPRATARCVLFRDGAKVKIETLVESDLERHGNSFVYSPYQAVRDGKRGMRFDGDGNAIGVGFLYSLTSPYSRDTGPTPFDLGRFHEDTMRLLDPSMGLWEYLSTATKTSCRFFDGAAPEEPGAAVPSNELVGVEFCQDLTEPVRMSYKSELFIAKARGCVPIVFRSYRDGRLSQKMVVTDIREIDPTRVFPLRSVTCVYCSKETLFWASDIQVTDLIVDHPVDPEKFKIDVLKRTPIIIAEMPTFLMTQSERVGLDDFDRLYDISAKIAASQRDSDEKRARQDVFSYYRNRILSAGLLSILVILSGGWERRRIKQRQRFVWKGIDLLLISASVALAVVVLALVIPILPDLGAALWRGGGTVVKALLGHN